MIENNKVWWSCLILYRNKRLGGGNFIFMKRYNVFLFLFILMFILTGCFSRQAQEIADWEDEVLIAEECGMDGLSCCAEDPKCKYGQTCCVNPVNNNKTYCAVECVCGELNKFCCSDGLSCGESLICLDGVCALCGKDGEKCCDSEQCDDDLLCAKGVCKKCGVEGGVCCAGEVPCVESKEKRVECVDNICSLCGMPGERSCSEEPFCSSGNLLNNNSCIPCGKTNNPCCNKEVSGYECESGLKCELGFCG